MVPADSRAATPAQCLRIIGRWKADAAYLRQRRVERQREELRRVIATRGREGADASGVG
jgi:hypothetical protein